MEETNNNSLIVNSGSFNGPLELLYQLIKERKVDIMTINLLDIASIYVEYVTSNFDNIKLDDIIDNLSIITYFIEYKSKKLLPNDSNDNSIDDDIEKDKYIQRLLLQKQFKELVPKLSEKFNERSKLHGRQDSYENTQQKNIYVEDAGLPESISPNVLLKALQRVYKKIEEQKTKTYKRIEIKELSIDDVTEEIIDVLKKLRNEKISMFLLFNSIDVNKITKQYMAVAFVSILVLARHGWISLNQEDNDDDIYISILNIDQNNSLNIDASWGGEDNE